jgi:electron transfer DM13
MVTAAAVVLTIGLAFALYWFQPWKLFIDHRVDEALPAVATEPVAIATAEPAEVADGRPRSTLVARGTLISHEHATSGTVSIVRQPDGHRVLAIADLRTSDGPVVKVWLTDRRVTPSGWHVFDDGTYVDLGGLKGNLGNQLYPIPDSADLSVLRSVTIWCDRFDVSFGAAELVAVGRA